MTKQTYLAPFHILAAVAAALAAGAAFAQTQQPAPTEPQATAPSTAPSTPPSTTPAPSGGMPMQGMEHGRQMQGMGQQMMEKEKGKAGEHPGMGGGPMMGK